MSRNLNFLLGVLTLTTALGTGCVTETRKDWGDNSSGYSTEDPAGSVASINSKLKEQAAARAAKDSTKADAEAANTVVLLVAHDAEGKPVYVETRRSCGDPAVDRRAQDYVLQKKRFPKGKADTVLLTLKRGEVPKK